MSTQTEVPLGERSQQPSDFITIKRIEVYVIPATMLDSAGYRVCLRLTTDRGHDWSELFIMKSEKPGDWISWSSGLIRFIGSFQLAAPIMFKTASMMKDERIFLLFAAAAFHSEDLNPSCHLKEYDGEQAVLFNQAISYISLF